VVEVVLVEAGLDLVVVSILSFLGVSVNLKKKYISLHYYHNEIIEGQIYNYQLSLIKCPVSSPNVR